MVETSILALPLLDQEETQRFFHHNNALHILEVFTAKTVSSATTTAQPGSPVEGDVYILPVGATGTDWASNPKYIAHFVNDAWNFYPPVDQLQFTALDTGYKWEYDLTSVSWIQTSRWNSTDSVLELQSVSRGFLPPRMTETQRDNISSPTGGLTVFNTTSSKLNFYSGSGWSVIDVGGGGGESNTASNIGTAGVGVFDGKVGVDLQFRKINAGSTKVTITDDTGNNEIDIDVVENQIDHDSLLNYAVGQHRIINDGGTSATELWSASKVNTELSGKSATGHGHTFIQDGDGDTKIQTDEGSGDEDIIRFDIGPSSPDKVIINSSGIGIDKVPTSIIDITSSGACDVNLNTDGANDCSINIDCEQTAAGQDIFTLLGQWSGTNAASMIFQTGSDTTNKDDGEILFKTSAAAGSLTSRLLIHNDGYISVLSDYVNFTSTGGTGGHGIRNNSGNMEFKNNGGSWTAIGAGGGEANTASNEGAAGVGVFKQKTVANLEFKNINAASSMVTVTDDTGNNEIDINIVPGQIDHDSLLNYAAGQHRIINDGGTSATELWSASKINTELSGKSATSHGHTFIQDADANTKIQTEESANENIIRFDINGAEVFKVDSNGISFPNLGYDIIFNEANGGGIGTTNSQIIFDDLNGIDFSTNGLPPGAGDYWHVDFTSVQVTTGDSTAITNLATVRVNEPDISLGAGGSVVNAAALYIAQAPTEGTNNFSLLVAAGNSKFAGNVLVSDYLNFGTGFGSGDYGFRSNAGVMEWKSSGGSWDTFGAGGGGETNTASNIGTAGVGVFDGKVGVDLQFKKINAGSTKVTITDDTGNNEIDIDIVENQIDHDSLLNYAVGQHRIINDGGTSATELWSASKVNTELSGKSDTGHAHAGADITSGNLAIARMPLSGEWALTGELGVTGDNIGFGIANPDAEFHIKATAGTRSFRLFPITSPLADYEFVSSNNTQPVMAIKGTGTADLLNVIDNTTEVFTILDGGNVGIQTVSPQANLEVEDNASSNTVIMKVTQDDESIVGFVLGNDTFSTTDTDGLRMVVLNSGLSALMAYGTAATLGFGISGTSKIDIQNDGDVVIADRLAIGSTTLGASVLLQLNSTTQGFLPPVMTTTQRGAIGTPSTGLIVYDSDLDHLCIYNGSAWRIIVDGGIGAGI